VTDDSVKTEYESKVVIDVLSNDSDVEDGKPTLDSATNPQNGSVKIDNNKIEYTPNSGFSGEDSFEYSVIDKSGIKARGKVTVNVNTKDNHAPIAKNDSITTEYESKVVIDVLSNDSDADGDNLTIKSVSSVKNGTAEIKDNKIEYTPNSGFSGVDKFIYTISDENGAEANAEVAVNVSKKPNSAPIAKDDYAGIKEDNSILVDVLSNDSDADGDKLDLSINSKPQNGVAEIKSGKVLYTPNLNYNGSDSFEYTISDGKAKSSAIVTIDIEAVNDRPVAKDDKITTKDNEKVIIDVLSNDSDVEGDALTIKLISKPAKGSAQIEDNKIEYTPEEGSLGDIEFNYTVVDSNSAESKATVTIRVTSSSEKPNTNVLDPLEKFTKIFDGIKGITKKDDRSYSFDDSKGEIDVDSAKDEIKLKHSTVPMPKEPLKDVKEFKLENNVLKLKFNISKNLKF